jgi:hypothetical protein
MGMNGGMNGIFHMHPFWYGKCVLCGLQLLTKHEYHQPPLCLRLLAHWTGYVDYSHGFLAEKPQQVQVVACLDSAQVSDTRVLSVLANQKNAGQPQAQLFPAQSGHSAIHIS